MVDTAQVVYTDHDGNTYNIFTDDLVIELKYEDLHIERKGAHDGMTVDPIREFRTVTCSCIMSGTDLNTLQTQLMDTTKVYDDTDPKITVVYKTGSSWTIKVAVVQVKYKMLRDDEWIVLFTFIERDG